MKRASHPFAIATLLTVALLGVRVQAENSIQPEVPAPVAPATPDTLPSSEGGPQTAKIPAPVFPLPLSHFSEVEDEKGRAMTLDLESTQEIIEALDHCTQEDLVKAADLKLTYKDLYDQPQDHRGKVASLEGVYCYIQEKTLPEGVRPAGAADGKVWLGQISIRRHYILNFISTGPIPANIKIGDGVKVAGVFLKRFAYYSRGDNGNAIERGPLLFIKNLQKTTLGGKPLPSDPMVDFIGGALFLVITIGMSAYVYTRWKSKHTNVKYFSTAPPKTIFPNKSRGGGGGIFPR